MMNITDRILPVGHPSRPGGDYDKTTVTIHETGNAAPGAGAYNHALYAENRTDKLGAHYYVDDKSIYRTIPDEEAANHSGSSTGNKYSIGIEICINPDSDFKMACENAAELAAALLHKRGLSSSSLRQHYNWNGKDCPETLRKSGWAAFAASVQKKIEGMEAETMAYKRVIKPDDILKIKPVMGKNNRPESIESVQARTGATIVLNGGTFGMTSPYPVDSSLTIDGKVYSDRYTGFGIAFNEARFAWSYKNSQGWPDFIGGYSTLIRNDIKEVSLPLNDKNGRTAVGITAAGELALYVVGKTDPAACTTGELADRMAALGCRHAINLDGSWSSQVRAPDGSISSTRDVLWYICIWLKHAEPTTPPSTDTLTVKATAKVQTLGLDGKPETGRYIASGDVCRIHTTITPGLLIRVEYPVRTGMRTAYIRSLDNFIKV